MGFSGWREATNAPTVGNVSSNRSISKSTPESRGVRTEKLRRTSSPAEVASSIQSPHVAQARPVVAR
jgi:hypothetical protein